MHRSLAASMLVAPLLVWLALSAPSAQHHAAAPAEATKAGGLPLVFEANGGRTDERARFIARGGGYTLFITPRESVMALGRGRAVVRTSLVGARPARVEGVDRLAGKVNYLVGPRSRWRTGIPTFGRVAARGVYPGVDLVYHGRQGQIEYDMQLAPGADAARIALAVSGARGLRLDDSGDLLIQTKAGVLRQHRPVAMQGRDRVPASFVLDGNRVRFRLGDYDHERELVIDPQISFAGVYGGDQNETARSVAVDSAGSPYIVGNTPSTDFPKANPFQGTKSSFDDAFVMKLTPDGTSPVYSTYLGGTNDDRGSAVAVDSSGHAYVAGEGTAGVAPTTTIGTAQVWVAKLKPDGSGLDYVVALGGNGGDHLTSIAVDGSGQAYVGGYSTSTNLPGFANGNSGNQDGIVFELNAAGTGTVFKRYIGGTGNDNVYGIDQRAGETYIAGTTGSTDFPTTAGVIQPTDPYGEDGFAAKLGPTGASVWATYVGGSDQGALPGDLGQDDILSDIAVTPSGESWVMGYGESNSRPFTSGLYSEPLPNNDLYIARISADGKGYEVAGYYGAGGPVADSEDPMVGGVATDAQGNGYFTSSTGSATFPGAHDANLQPNGGGGVNTDAVVFKLSGAGHSPTKIFSTYLGGENGGEAGYEIATSPSDGAVWVAGGAGSDDFPKVASTRTPVNGDAMVAKYDIVPATITDGPAEGSTTPSPTPSFSFSSTESLASYQCRTDADAFATCTSPNTTTQLGDGPHTFDVRPLDAGGTPGPAARRSFTVDTQLRPRLTFAPNPVLAGNATTLDASASTTGFAITKYEFDTDGNGTFDVDTGATPKTVQTYLTPGVVHNLAVRVTDAGGRTATATGDLTVTARPTGSKPFGVSINKGAQFTNDPDVKITANFPLITSSILVSNDGGFADAKTFMPLTTIPWKLDSSGPERLPKTVYVRFLPSAIAGLTFQDDIILDETPPKVQSASIAPAAASAASTARTAKLRKWKLRVKATDKTSGVKGIQATSNKRKPGKLLAYKRKLTVKSAKRPKFVRARDRAGNYSRWRKLR